MSVLIPSFYAPIDEALCEQKVEYLTRHFETQRSRHWFVEKTFRAQLRIRGVEVATRYAEAFHARKMTWGTGNALQ